MTASFRHNLSITVSAFIVISSAGSLRCEAQGKNSAADLKEEFRIKREHNFEFTKKPEVTRNGDRITIAFETAGYCDVSVCIENMSGRIIRHLACGILGDKAPPPFRKGSREQVLVWDGKDDRGRYAAGNSSDYGELRVRVSLGLKPRFERHFYWSPFRRVCNQGHAPTLNAPPPFVAQPEGVYVLDGSMFDHLRLFDHDGNYVRTVYPFPAGKLDELRGVQTRKFPQSGRKLPYKDGNYRSTLLTSGTSFKGPYLNQLFGLSAMAMAVRKGRIALVCRTMNRLATDGSTGGLPLEGPKTQIGGLLPRSAAFSPDGKTVYVTGWNKAGWKPNWRIKWVQGVGRLDFERGGKLETFAGSLSDNPKTGGTEPGKFKTPVSVATDPKGRVYVADRFNDRVQVFAPDGKHLKSIKVPGGDASRPSEVEIDQKTGDIYIFSWYIDCYVFRKGGMADRKAMLFHLGPFENPKLKASYPLPIPDQSRRGRYGGDELQGREFRATIDSWAPGDGGPRVWLVRGAAFGRGGSIAALSPLVLRINREKGKLEKITDFNDRARKHLPSNRYYANGNKWLAADDTTGEMYIQHGRTPAVIEPGAGKSRIVKLPFNPMSGGMYFDLDGMGYLRTSRYVGRFNIDKNDRWREVPFDYGEERGGRISVVPLHTPSIHGQPGLSVSVNQDVVAAYIIGLVKTHDRSKDRARAKARKKWTPWKPEIFPGRGGNTIVSVWNKNGKRTRADAVRGIGYLAGIFMDRHGDFYCAAESRRNGYFDRMTGTFIKVKPDRKVLSSGTTPVPILNKPDRAPDTFTGGGGIRQSWWEGAEWFYGGMGFCGKNNSTCHCPKFQAAHDYFARSFVPETGHYSVAVLDSEGNLITRIGRYGNVDDGVPLVNDKKVKGWKPQPLGGDEVGLFYPAYLAVDTDERLFIHDPGNQRILSVTLGYHADETEPVGKK